MPERIPHEGKVEANEFNDPSKRCVLRVSPKVLDYMAKVTPEDLESRMEKFQMLFGSWEMQGEDIVIDLRSVAESEALAEGQVDRVEVNRTFFFHMRDHLQNMMDERVIGEYHTHPVQDDGSQWALSPSEVDFNNWGHAVVEGWVGKEDPFVFGIGCQDREGHQISEFYRMVRIDDQNLQLVLVDEIKMAENLDGGNNERTKEI